MHQIPERLQELTDRLLGRDYDDDDDDDEEDDEEEAEEPDGPPLRAAKSLSEDLLKTGPIDLGALDGGRRGDDHDRAGAHAAARPSGRRSRTAPRRRRTCRRSTSRSS